MMYCNNCPYWRNYYYKENLQQEDYREKNTDCSEECGYRNAVRAELLNSPVFLNGVNVSSNQFPALNFKPYGSVYSYIYIPAVQLSKAGAVVRWAGYTQGLTINFPNSGNNDAMQRDIDFLREESSTQKDYEATYQSFPNKSVLKVTRVTASSIQFEEKPLISTGNYVGRYTAGQSYPFFEDADMGGKRYIIIKDNFGVWHVFMYTVRI